MAKISSVPESRAASPVERALRESLNSWQLASLDKTISEHIARERVRFVRKFHSQLDGFNKLLTELSEEMYCKWMLEHLARPSDKYDS